MNGENPCNICHADCETTDCLFHQRYNKAYECIAWECMGNYEGSCLLDLYDDCGCRKYFEGGKK